MSSPLVTVIVPVYNTEKYLAECVDSILAQTYAALEVLLIDDGSTDGSPALCDRYAARDARVQVLHQENAGVSAARNAGIERASGKYIAFADSDDRIAPEMIASLVDQAEAHGADCVSCRIQQFWPDGKTQTQTYPNNFRKLYHGEPHHELYKLLLTGSSAGLGSYCNKLYRSDMIRRGAVRFPPLKSGEDISFCFDYLFRCQSVLYTDDAFYFYRRHEESFMGQVRPLDSRIAEMTAFIQYVATLVRDMLEPDAQQYWNTQKFNALSYFTGLAVNNTTHTYGQKIADLRKIAAQDYYMEVAAHIRDYKAFGVLFRYRLTAFLLKYRLYHLLYWTRRAGDLLKRLR